MTTERAARLRAPYTVARIKEAKDDWWDVLDATGQNIALTGGPEALLIRDALNAFDAPAAGLDALRTDMDRLGMLGNTPVGEQTYAGGWNDAMREIETYRSRRAAEAIHLPAAGLDAAMAFLRKRLVGSPPNVDMEDVYFASLLDEAEAVGRAALLGAVDHG